MNEQVLREQLSVPGVPFELFYSSKFAKGRSANHELQIQLAPNLPGLIDQVVKIEIAGQLHSYTAQPGEASYQFVWDGKDVFGRPVFGARTANIQVQLNFQSAYYAPSVRSQSFSQVGGSSLATGVNARLPYTEVREQKIPVFGVDVQNTAIAQWTPSIVHRLDMPTQTVFYGDGTSSEARLRSLNISRVTSFYGGTGGEGAPADSVSLTNAKCLAVDNDGGILIGEAGRIRKLRSDNTIITIAGDGSLGNAGDGGLALDAQVSRVLAIAVNRMGEIFFADDSNSIRKIDRQGLISKLISSSPGFAGDGGSALNAKMNYPGALTVGPDDALYFWDGLNFRVRRIDPSGVIDTFAGDGTSASQGDGVAARSASFTGVTQLFFDGLNDLVIVESPGSGLVRKIAKSGLTDFWLGSRSGNFDDGVMRNQTFFYGSWIIENQDGSLLYNQTQTSTPARLRTLSTTGVVGTSGLTFVSPNWNPSQVIDNPASKMEAAVLSRDGKLFGLVNSQLISISNDIGFWQSQEYFLASQDGSEIFVFNKDGRHERTLFAKTGTTKFSFAYDQNGFLVSIKDENSLVTTILRDSAGLPSSIVGPYGQTILLVADVDQNLQSLTWPTGETYRFSYQDQLLKKFERPNGNASTFLYDSRGLLVQDQSADGGHKTISRTVAADDSVTVSALSSLGTGPSSRTYISNGNEFAETTTAAGDRYSESRPLNATMRTRVDLLDGSSPTTDSVYFAADPRFGSASPYVSFSQRTNGYSPLAASVTRSFSPKGSLFSFTQSETLLSPGIQETMAYSSANKTYSMGTYSGRGQTLSIDSFERPTQTQIGGLAKTQYSYDQKGRLSEITQDQKSTKFSYDSNGHLQTVTDPLGHVSETVFDLSGRLLRTRSADGRIISNTYDTNSMITSVTAPNGQVFGMLYNLVDLLSGFTPPTDDGSQPRFLIDYDLDKNPIRTSWSDGVSIFRDYSLGKITKEKEQNGDEFSYQYQGSRVSSITGPQGSSQYLWKGDQLISRSQKTLNYTNPTGAPRMDQLIYKYDAAGRITSLELGFGGPVFPIVYSYTYDRMPTGIGPMAIGYTQKEGLLSLINIGAMTESFTYNQYGELASKSLYLGPMKAQEFLYQRDLAGRITQIDETASMPTTQTKKTKYVYDLAGRLTDVSINGIASGHYEYDQNSNRVKSVNAGNTKLASFDVQDRIKDFNNNQYLFNLRGQLVEKTDSTTLSKTKYTYNAFGDLKSVLLPNQTKIDYLINGEHRRIGRVVNGQLDRYYGYDVEGRMLYERQPVAGGVFRWYIYLPQSHSPDAFLDGSTGQYYKLIKDHLGSIRLVINTSNSMVMQELDYDEWGQVIKDTNPGFQLFGFAGGVYDRDTKLLRFGARDYDAEIGRWTAKDPLLFGGGDVNLYGYVANEPVNNIDPSGLSQCTYSNSTHQLSCTSNDGSASASTNAFSGGTFDGTTYLPVPTGAYRLRPANSRPSNFFSLDPGFWRKLGYAVGISRGGFMLHPGTYSEGCITVDKNNKIDMQNYNTIQNMILNEIGNSSIEVTP